MMLNRTYQVAFFSAVLLHAGLLLAFMIHPSTKRPVMQLEAKHAAKTPPKQEIVKAVSVDEKEVTAAVQKLKAERVAKARAEQSRQKKLAAEAEALRLKRVQEQKKLARLRAENARAAEKRKQAAIAEAKRQKEVEQQKALEARKLEQLKQEQVALQKEQDAAKVRAKAERERELEQARLEKARIDAANRARMSGVVDKYKVLILGAIGEQWILPDQVNRSLSSRFKIRLAPNGTVLDVQLTRSSGDAVLDRSAQAAIYKASPLPVPSEPEMFNVFREISLTVRPENVRG
ncbi:MAG: cell envelope integrity protein TolA [Legionellaceae bacterium]|nr:cell envelope integrity protein TolA [Legionellaceae bacterium]